MSRPSLDFLLYLVGARKPRTSVTLAETTLIRRLAQGRRSIAEVGVFEGATSAVLAEAMDPAGRLSLVDPFFLGTRPEQLMRLSYTRWIATRTVRPWRHRISFLRLPSLAAAAALASQESFDLIFIDADHSYQAVKNDFAAWSPLLRAGGVIALHDSRMCEERPDLLPTTGPVRLAQEILSGEHGPWRRLDAAESLTALARED